MGKEIAVNTNTLKNEVDTMTRALQQLRNRIDEAYAAVSDLDKMWDGPANVEFRTEFNNDRLRLVEICNSIERLINAMGKSRVEYEKCESDVKAIVDGIRI